MDELNQKLAQILNNPESMERVRKMAEGLLSDEQQAQPQQEAATNIGGDELSTIMNIVSKLNHSGDDPRTTLLSALKPHLSEPKREKVDTAIKILRLLELWPLLKESGVLGKLL